MLIDYKDVYTWEKERKILTEQQLQIPGLEMIGYNYEPKNSHILMPHVHRDSMEIIYMVSGIQTYSIDARQYTFQGNQFLITPANVPHSSGSTPYGRCETYWLRLYRQYCPGFLQMDDRAGRQLHNAIFSLHAPVILPNVSLKKNMAEAFSLLTDAGELARIRACALLQNIFAQMCLGKPAEEKISEEILQATIYVAEHIQEQISLQGLAAKINLSLSAFNQRFLREIGTSPREYINMMKMEKAKEMLMETQKNITEIAFDLSFSSSNYFSCVFHKITGKTPTEYRQSNRETI